MVDIYAEHFLEEAVKDAHLSPIARKILKTENASPMHLAYFIVAEAWDYVRSDHAGVRIHDDGEHMNTWHLLDYALGREQGHSMSLDEIGNIQKSVNDFYDAHWAAAQAAQPMGPQREPA